MDWLRSEDLKEEKDVTAPTSIVAGIGRSKLSCIWLVLIESWVMGKREATKQSAKAILAEVIKEMAKPKVVKSARTGFRLWSAVLVVQDNSEKGTVDFKFPVIAHEAQFPG